MWKTIRRETSLVEHVCSHGVGHPNYYSAARLDAAYEHEKGTWSTHGCDGCCSEWNFPGRKLSDEDILHRLDERLSDAFNAEISVDEFLDHLTYAFHDLSINIRERDEVQVR